MSEVIDFRERAREHLNLAKEHLASGDAVRLRYAALELRMCIESLSYDLLQLHRSAASFKLMQSWQADKVIKELDEMVRGASGTRDIKIDFEGSDPIEATEFRMDQPWLRKNYHSLGSFLHPPTVRQIEAGKDESPERVRDKCTEISLFLDKVLGSEIFGIKIDRNCSWICDFEGCGFIMERDIDWFRHNNVTACPKCGAEHNVWIDLERLCHRVRVGNWICKECGAHNAVAAHQIKDGAVVRCCLCDAGFAFRQEIRLHPIKA